MRTCESELRDCRLSCSGFSDADCNTACHDEWTDCVLGHSEEDCLRDCPCWSTYDECWIACGEDYDCQDACTADYEACLGVDPERVASCREGCTFQSELCLAICDDDFLDVDWEGWVLCQYDCYDEQLDCNIGCL
jgi:hypothetical protein